VVHSIYGVWDGAVHDFRRAPSDAQQSFLDGLDDFAPDDAIKAFIADRGFLVFDRTTNLAEAFRSYLARAAGESCGRCTPCRVGTQRLRDLLARVTEATHDGETLDEAQELARQVAATSLCGLGRSVAGSLLVALTHFRDEFTPLLPAQALFQASTLYATAPCVEACPSKVDVPRFIDGIKGGKFDFALGVVLDKYPMVASCGRVCVRFCEDACRRSAADGAVGIRMLKRYVADQAIGAERLRLPHSGARHAQRVAVVGAGPAGLTCAYKLLLDGFAVDIYDAQRAAGGMASVGIPSYRLPKDVLKADGEDIVRELGGQFFFGRLLGRDFSVDDLMAKGYDAAFLAYGASQGGALGIHNEDPELAGYVSGIEFLDGVHRRVELGEEFDFGGDVTGDVVVVGGGNVAMDCVRSALRLGARSVHLVYRRTRADMPADVLEVEAAEKEGVIFHCLVNPSALIVDGGRVVGVDLAAMRQTDLDAKGRRNVVPIPGESSFMACDLLVAAIGQQVDRGLLTPQQGILLDRWNCIVVDPDTLETSRRGVFAGGDCVLGPLSLVNALDHGERAAASIRDYLLEGRVCVTPARRMQKLLARNRLLEGECLSTRPLPRARAHEPELPVGERVGSFAEVDAAISRDAAYAEAQRCLRCYRLYSAVTEKPLDQASVGRQDQQMMPGVHA
jgi:formate dehydrogenase beta subunit